MTRRNRVLTGNNAGPGGGSQRQTNGRAHSTKRNRRRRATIPNFLPQGVPAGDTND